MLGDQDPSGFYSALGITPSATSDEIKKAYKSKAQQCHPDKNPAPEATRQFQRVNEAYQALGDANRRAEYDAQSYMPPERSSPRANHRPDPIICSICSRPTAQPRYVIYRHVISAVIFTWRFGQQGVFCAECGAKIAYRTSLKTWLAGWWGIPWGPIYSVHAIFSNMFGGEQPPLNNFRILSWQAAYFAYSGRLELAYALAHDALGFASKLSASEKSSNPEIDSVVRAMSALCADANAENRPRKLKRLWGIGSTAFKTQMGGAVLVTLLTGGIAFFVSSATKSSQAAYKHVPPTEQAVQPGPATDAISATAIPPPPPSYQIISPAPSTLSFSEPPVELPVTGNIRTLWIKEPDVVLAPLKIITALGSPNPHFSQGC